MSIHSMSFNIVGHYTSKSNLSMHIAHTVPGRYPINI